MQSIARAPSLHRIDWRSKTSMSTVDLVAVPDAEKSTPLNRIPLQETSLDIWDKSIGLKPKTEITLISRLAILFTASLARWRKLRKTKPPKKNGTESFFGPLNRAQLLLVASRLMLALCNTSQPHQRSTALCLAQYRTQWTTFCTRCMRQA